MNSPNFKPADELAAIRERIKQLKAREAEIKAGMLDGSIEMSGDYSLARIVTRKSRRFDRKAAEAELGDLSRFMVETETQTLLIEEMDDGEVIE